jgi:transcriptional regulator with XRE-family HTH domain
MMDDKTAYIIATGRVLRDQRESQGLSVTDLAGKSGLPQLRIEQIEAGSVYAVAADLLSLASGLSTPIERFTDPIEAVMKELLWEKRAAPQLPDLQPILDAYLQAHAIVATAGYALIVSENAGSSELITTALRQGVTALRVVNDRLEEARMQLERLRSEWEVRSRPTGAGDGLGRGMQSVRTGSPQSIIRPP